MNNSSAQPDSLLILIVDDDKFTRLQIRERLQKEGYRVEEMTNGEQCLAAYTRLHPDIILLDGMMPVMDGFTCCAQLRTLPGGERIALQIYIRTYNWQRKTSNNTYACSLQ